jgi:hypothetical protein
MVGEGGTAVNPRRRPADSGGYRHPPSSQVVPVGQHQVPQSTSVSPQAQ